MLPSPAGREASSGGGAPPYARCRAERTNLYQRVEEYYEKILAHLDAKGAECEATRRARGVERHRGGGCATRQRNATVASFGLCRHRRGNGVACPGNWRAGEKCAGRSVAGENSGA